MDELAAIAGGATSAPGALPEEPHELRDDFLKLLVAQLAHQDPLNPMDNGEFVSQLAQFSSLEQMTNVAQSVQMLAIAEAASQNAAMVGLIGHEIIARVDSFSIDGVTSPDLGLQLGADAEEVHVVIRDSSGRAVRTIDLGAMEAGEAELAWDGTDDAGVAVPPGAYQVEVTAIGVSEAEGPPVPVEVTLRGIVSAITFHAGVPRIVIGDTEIILSDVRSVIAS